jgi:hypothetical protein
MKRQILLVDEDNKELHTFMAAIENIPESLECTYCSNVSQAVEMLRKRVPDFIFIGKSPDVSELQLLSFVCNEPKLRGSKAFIYSDNINEETYKMAKLLGASGCIEKNGTINWLTHQLKAIVAEILMPRYTLMRNSI